MVASKSESWTFVVIFFSLLACMSQLMNSPMIVVASSTHSRAHTHTHTYIFYLLSHLLCTDEVFFFYSQCCCVACDYELLSLASSHFSSSDWAKTERECVFPSGKPLALVSLCVGVNACSYVNVLEWLEIGFQRSTTDHDNNESTFLAYLRRMNEWHRLDYRWNLVFNVHVA